MNKRYKFYLCALIISLSIISLIYVKTPGIKANIVKTDRPKIQLKPVHIIAHSMPFSFEEVILEDLSKGLNLKQVQISNDFLINDELNEFYADDYVAALTYIQPNTSFGKYNNFTNKIWLHLIDPRDALINWHKATLANKKLTITIYPPQDFFTWTKQKQIDWGISNIMPEIISWLQNWYVFTANQQKFEILITKHKDLQLDIRGFYRNILNFHEIPERQFVYKNAVVAKQSIREHDSWQDFYTTEQLAKIKQMVPDNLLHAYRENK